MRFTEMSRDEKLVATAVMDVFLYHEKDVRKALQDNSNLLSESCVEGDEFRDVIKDSLDYLDSRIEDKEKVRRLFWTFMFNSLMEIEAEEACQQSQK